MGRKFLNVILASVAAFSACTVTETPTPPLQGPSELALSLTTTVNPDTISQDGASQSLIVVQVFDGNGQPARNIPFRAEIIFGGVATDFGTLSARTLVTDANGRASLTYTAPPFVTSVDTFTVVTILLTPSAGDFAGAWSRQVSIRLVPPGTILPGGPTPNFTLPSTSSSPFTDVLFDGSASTAAPGTTIVTYSWTFGDGGTASGPTATHRYSPGTYTVTLTVVDSNGISASRSRLLTVSAGTPPTADFVFSPTAPVVNQDIFFNASTSKPAVARTIVRYDWNFGSGAPRTGITVSKSYDQPATYSVVLTVTDDVGQIGTKTTTVTVGSPGTPTANFTMSPSPASVGAVVTFDGRTSFANAAAVPIARYEWSFGDGSPIQSTTAPTTTITHTYSTTSPVGPPAGFTVTLTVFDTNGNLGSTTHQLLVQ